MRSEDADVTVWLAAPSGRHYCLRVVSVRVGRPGSSRWQRPSYRWRVEERRGPGSPHYLGRARTQVEDTLREALRRARRAADALERTRLERSRRTGSARKRA